MKITLNAGQLGWCFSVDCEDGQDYLIQSDWDYPPFAHTFGWNINNVQLCCECRHQLAIADANIGDLLECDNCGRTISNVYCEHGSDGTVPCKQCGVATTEFMSAAMDYLTEHIGDTVEDPGYFNELVNETA